MKRGLVVAVMFIAAAACGCGRAEPLGTKIESPVVWKGYATERQELAATYWNVSYCLAGYGQENNKVVPFVYITADRPELRDGTEHDGTADLKNNVIFLWAKVFTEAFRHQAIHIITGLGEDDHDHPVFSACE